MAAAVAAVLSSAAAVSAQPVITINGQAASFSPGPIERGGRVFVPLRGIFERLGATVVYANGTINATGADGRSVSLTIGSTQATVAGQTQTLDVAPFVVGASTYVPLRFVSSSLGAGVNYDASNNLIAINTSGTNVPARPVRTVSLRDEQPGAGASVPSHRPTISASFTGPVDPNTVRVILDGLDITGQTTRSQTGIVYAPPSPLQAGRHRVIVRGTDTGGQAFERSWDFTTGAAAVAPNAITIDAPRDGTAVSPQFIVRGTTRPGARVHITAGAVANQIPGLSFGTGSYVGDVIADSRGAFGQQINVAAISGGQIVVTVVSTAPATRETAEARVRLRVR